MDKKYRPDLDSIIDKGRLIIFIWNVDGSVKYVSRNISLFGYVPENFYTGKMPYDNIIHPDDVFRVIEEVSNYAINNIYEYQQQYRIITKDGEITRR